jgi:thioredoxin-related protein
MLKSHRFVVVGIAAAWLVFGSLAGMTRAEDNPWTTDFDAAKTKAKSEDKLLLVSFVGSDWCGWCKKLKHEVFDQKAFGTQASKDFVLVELDFPRNTPLSPSLKEQNAKLQKEYGVHGFPTVYLMDAEGHVVAHTGYQAGGPDKYLKLLKSLFATYQSAEKLKEKLEKAEGPERAKILDGLVAAYDKLDAGNKEKTAWMKEIVSLDDENKAGLKKKYVVRLMLEEAVSLANGKKTDEAQAVLDKALEAEGITPEQTQTVWFLKGKIYAPVDMAKAVECLKKALQAAPRSPMAASIKKILAQIEKPAGKSSQPKGK